MRQYLTNHARNKVWAHVDQDRQAILQPARLTKVEGVFNKFTMFFQSFVMPEKNVRCHLYHIGRVFPSLINILSATRKWTTFEKACELGNTIFDIYTASGVQVPRSRTYYLITEDDAVIVCVVEDKSLPYNFHRDPIFIRTYDNVFYASDGFIDPVDGSALGVVVGGGKKKTAMLANALITEANSYKSKPGMVYFFHNGIYRYELDITNFKPNDTLEYVYDPSIYKVIDFNIDQLEVFDSTMDACSKYLLHYDSLLSYEGQYIDYMDDIDVFIVDPVLKNGVFYHKNQYSSMRMLTHKDYSLPVHRVLDFIEKNKEYIKLRHAEIRLHIRRASKIKPLQPVENMIRQLYKLPNTAIVGAMVGVNANVDIWRADALEQSAYTSYMSLKYAQIDAAKTLQMYGYYGSTFIAAKSPLPVVPFNGLKIASASIAYQYGSKAYEYDVNGHLLTSSFANNHPGGEVYNVQDQNAKLVEFQLYDMQLDSVTKKDEMLDEYVNTDNVSLDPAYDWRMYVFKLGTEQDANVWKDVTGTSKYTVTNNTLKWNVDLLLHKVCVRSNKKAIGAVLNFDPTQGVQLFKLKAKNNTSQTATDLEIPLGYLDVFLNGKNLIEGIDYYVKFPNVCLYNKKHLLQTGNKLAWRYYGHCTQTLTHQNPGDIGFVKNNNLSVNAKFNIRDDRVQRIIVGGAYKTITGLDFGENPTYVFMDSDNGSPYQVRDELIPLKPLYPLGVADTYAELNRSVSTAKKIEDYLSVHIPEVSPTTDNPITSYYPVYSPFVNRITYAITTGGITPPEMGGVLDNDVVRALVAPYLYLYDYDPNNNKVGYDAKYVQVHPHHLDTIVQLDAAQYRFIDRVVKLYAPNMKISNHYNILQAD